MIASELRKGECILRYLWCYHYNYTLIAIAPQQSDDDEWFPMDRIYTPTIRFMIFLTDLYQYRCIIYKIISVI